MTLAELFEGKHISYKPSSESNYTSQNMWNGPPGAPRVDHIDPEKTMHIRLSSASKGKRADKIRRRWRTIRDMKKPVDDTNLSVKTDSEDLTGSGAHSIMNAPYKY